MVFFRQRPMVRAKNPNSWYNLCECNFEVVLALLAGLVLFFTLLRFVKKGQHGLDGAGVSFLPQGIIFGVLGIVVIPIAECIAYRIQGNRSQTRSFCVLLVANICFNLCVAAVPEGEVQMSGLFSISLMTKFSVPMLGWDIRLSAAFICSSCASFCLTLLAFTEGQLRSVLILSDWFFVLAAGVTYLAITSSLQGIFHSVGMLEVDNNALLQILKSSCDGELYISLSSEGEAWIDRADLQFFDSVPDVEGESLNVITCDDTECQCIVEDLGVYAGPTLCNSTFKDRHGKEIPVELFVVGLKASPSPPGNPAGASRQGYVRLAEQLPVSNFLVGIRLAHGAAAHRRSHPRIWRRQQAAGASASPSVHGSIDESLSSVLPNVVGRTPRRDNRSDSSPRRDPSPVVSSSEKDKSTHTNSSLLFQKAKLDLSYIVDLGVREHWLIDISELELQPNAVLGKGGFGVVVECQYYGTQLAAKITLTPEANYSLADMHVCDGFFHELRMLRHLRHPNIVQFYGACIEPHSREIVLVFEKIDALTLEQFVPDLPQTSDSSQARLKIMLDLSRALDYMHARKPAMTHGDLKPPNVFVYTDGPTAILSDFGLAKKMSSQARARGFTTRWVAPEILLGTSGLTTATDIFSFGRLMSFIATGVTPLQDLDEDDIVRLVRSGQPLPMTEWPRNSLPDVCASLAESCLATLPELRPLTPALRKLLEKAPDLLGLPSAGPDQPPALLSLLPSASPPAAGATDSLRIDEPSSRTRREMFLRLLEAARGADRTNFGQDV
eukprot:TRINITY_DN9649_c0_g2_i1.p1 TRINITY_DN9649_c0_g2~~TRINITY_DN9649_c0_g2_i1.p1  ORF type:complete len:781 (-),score=77.92 TRINITY_DN9649_c0_g2_i1:412-2754(-)